MCTVLYLTMRCAITHNFLGISNYSIRGFLNANINQSVNKCADATMYGTQGADPHPVPLREGGQVEIN